MHFVIFGAGAVGGVIGARLRLAGIPTTLIARGDHLTAIQERGLVLETAAGRQTVDVAVASSADEVSWTDDTVVLLTVKSQQTQAALAALVAAAPAGIAVVSAQNGVANEAEILRRFARTYSICVMQPCAHVEPGVVVQQCDPIPGILDIGRYPGGVDDTAGSIAAALESAGFISEPRADIMSWKHRKLILNLGNGVQACFEPGPEADELQARARAEGEAALAAAGVPLVSEGEDTARRGDLLQGRTRSDAFGSSWQSLSRATGSIETDWLNGEIVLLGRTHDVPTPANELIQRISNQLARTAGPPRSLDAARALAELSADRGASEKDEGPPP
jgi:2-dehydropantoate 2-reductase